MQTETGAREGVLTAHQIDNLSIISRSSLELLRILPGVVAPDQNQLESVSFLCGANDTQTYTINGIRTSNNAVSLDGSNLIDFGANGRRHGQREQRHGAGGEDPELELQRRVRLGRGQHQRGHEGRQLAVSRHWLWVRARSPARGQRSIERHPRHREAEERILLSWREHRRSAPLPFTGYNSRRDRLFFWVGRRGAAAEGRFRKHADTTISQAARSRGSQRVSGRPRPEPESPVIVLVPGGFPGAGTPAPNNDLRRTSRPLGRRMAGLYPLPNHSDPDNRYNYVYSALEPTNRVEMKGRVDWNISASTKAYVRIAHDTEDVESPARRLGMRTARAADPGAGTNRGRSYAGNVVQVLSPTLTHEVLVTYSRLTLDNAYRDPSMLRKDALGVDFVGFFPDQSPVCAARATQSWSGAQLGDFFAPLVDDVYAHNDELLFADKLTKVHGAHALKFGVSLARLQKQQNYYNNEDGAMVFAPSTPGGTGSQIGDLLVGRPFRSSRVRARRTAYSGCGTWMLFAQDSWKIRPNLTLESACAPGTGRTTPS